MTDIGTWHDIRCPYCSSKEVERVGSGWVEVTRTDKPSPMPLSFIDLLREAVHVVRCKRETCGGVFTISRR